MKSIAIIGIGNYLMGDEGVGIHAIEACRQKNWPPGVEIIDGGTSGVSLLHMIRDRDLAVFIDCADFGGSPGELRVFEPKELKRRPTFEISLHATDLLTSLDLARDTGNYPRSAVIIGIQPSAIRISTELSFEVSASLGSIISTVEREINRSCATQCQE